MGGFVATGAGEANIAKSFAECGLGVSESCCGGEAC